VLERLADSYFRPIHLSLEGAGVSRRTAFSLQLLASSSICDGQAGIYCLGSCYPTLRQKQGEGWGNPHFGELKKTTAKSGGKRIEYELE
jgi:hypothetical protein